MRTRIMGGLLVTVALVGTGCAEKLTYERYQTIHKGMASDAVKATLGDPWMTTEQTWVYANEDKGITAKVYFDGQKVIGKEWSSPDRPLEGENPRVQQPGDADELKIQQIK